MVATIASPTLCGNCFSGDVRTPANGHPAYVECPFCGAIELTYVPQDYQEPMHSVDLVEVWNTKRGEWELQIQILGAFGG